MSKPPTDWITLSEAADLLGAHNIHFKSGTIGRWARAGRLVSIKLGNRRYVRKTQIRSLVRPHGAVHGEDLQPGLFEDLED